MLAQGSGVGTQGGRGGAQGGRGGAQGGRGGAQGAFYIYMQVINWQIHV